MGELHLNKVFTMWNRVCLNSKTLLTIFQIQAKRVSFSSQVFCVYRTSLYLICASINRILHSKGTSWSHGFIVSLQSAAPSSVSSSHLHWQLCVVFISVFVVLFICVGLRAPQGQEACLPMLASHTAPGPAYLMRTQWVSVTWQGGRIRRGVVLTCLRHRGH